MTIYELFRIERYSFENEQFLILAKNGIDIPKQYPTIYNYLDTFGEKFKTRGAQGKHWTNLRACSFFDDFKKEKIVWIELSDKGRFALCKDEIYLLNSAYFMLSPKGYSNELLLGILNSKVIQFFMECIAESSGMGTLRWINNNVKHIPIPKNISTKANRSFLQKVKMVITEKSIGNDAKLLEKQIDILVYKLYNLTWEEVNIIDTEFEMSEDEYEGIKTQTL